MPKKVLSDTNKAQSAIEYMTTYGWAIIIISLVVVILFVYTAAPQAIVINTCNFVDGAYCNDMIVATNAITHVTSVGLFLTNIQQYPLKNPELFVSINRVNTTQSKCSPNFVLAGGSILCTVILPVNSTIGEFLSGTIYLNATYCGLSTKSYASTHNCSTGVQQTYIGSFAGHTQPLVSTKSFITLTATNYTQAANGNPDQLTATVKLLGYPLKGATVNFTTSNSVYSISSNPSATNAAGSALSSISGSIPGNTVVSAMYAGISNNIAITFSEPLVVVYLPKNFTYCTTAGITAYIDGVGYTCAQLSVMQFGYSKGTTHTYAFLSPVGVSSNTRESFKSILVNHIPYTANSGSILVNSNLTVPFNYSTQYYLTEVANPSGAGSVSPGSEWFPALSHILISQSSSAGWFFNGWTGTGAGSYSGSLSSTTVTANNPITESANYYSTSTVSASTSTGTTSTGTTSTGTTSTGTTSTGTTSTGTTSTGTTSTGTTSTGTTSTGTTSTILSSTYTLSISLNPLSASDYNYACFDVNGYSAVCTTTPESSPSSATYPSGSTLSYVCAFILYPTPYYTFFSFSGSYNSSVQCTTGLSIPITSNMNITANYYMPVSTASTTTSVIGGSTAPTSTSISSTSTTSTSAPTSTSTSVIGGSTAPTTTSTSLTTTTSSSTSSSSTTTSTSITVTTTYLEVIECCYEETSSGGSFGGFWECETTDPNASLSCATGSPGGTSLCYPQSDSYAIIQGGMRYPNGTYENCPP